MSKLIKITCLYKKPQASSVNGITEKDIEVFEQYVDAAMIVAVCVPSEDERLPNASSMIITSLAHFQTTEGLDDLAERVNAARKEY